VNDKVENEEELQLIFWIYWISQEEIYQWLLAKKAKTRKQRYKAAKENRNKGYSNYL
jgi:hypothetical protein